MFSKILVGVTGVALLGIGGFLYWDHQNCPSRQGCNQGTKCLTGVMPCCLQPADQITSSPPPEELMVMPRQCTTPVAACCGEPVERFTTSTSPEALSVMPRAVVEQ